METEMEIEIEMEMGIEIEMEMKMEMEIACLLFEFIEIRALDYRFDVPVDKGRKR